FAPSPAQRPEKDQRNGRTSAPRWVVRARRPMWCTVITGDTLQRRTRADWRRPAVLNSRGFSMQRKLHAVSCAAFIVGVLLPHSAFAQSCPLNVPHVNGTWTILPYQMPINPISATLLRNGKVLIVAGSENDASNNSVGSESYRAAVWDPTGATESSI